MPPLSLSQDEKRLLAEVKQHLVQSGELVAVLAGLTSSLLKTELIEDEVPAEICESCGWSEGPYCYVYVDLSKYPGYKSNSGRIDEIVSGLQAQFSSQGSRCIVATNADAVRISKALQSVGIKQSVPAVQNAVIEAEVFGSVADSETGELFTAVPVRIDVELPSMSISYKYEYLGGASPDAAVLLGISPSEALSSGAVEPLLPGGRAASMKLSGEFEGKEAFVVYPVEIVKEGSGVYSLKTVMNSAKPLNQPFPSKPSQGGLQGISEALSRLGAQPFSGRLLAAAGITVLIGMIAFIALTVYHRKSKEEEES